MSQQQTPYIGSKISLISKLDIRYEGTLFSVDSNESTIALSKVRSFGTEDRPTVHPVPGRDEVYEYIIFKASDIKDLIVCEAQKSQTIGGLPYDPAIVSVSQKPTAKATAENQSAPTEKSFRPVTPTNPPRSYDRGEGGNRRDNNAPFVVPKASHPIPPLANPQLHQQQRHAYDSNWERGRGNADYQRPPHQQRQNRAQGDGAGNYRQGAWNQQRGRQAAHPPHHTGSRDTQKEQKMQGDFDFEKANEKFEEKMHQLSGNLDKVNLQGQGEDVQEEEKEASSQGESECEGEDVDGNFYDKKSSFFDKISCEALEREEGRNNRPNWRKERVTNEETFGYAFVRTQGTGGGYRRGYGRPNYQQQRQGRYGQDGGGYSSYSFGRSGAGGNHNRGQQGNRRYPNPRAQAAES